MRELEIKTSKKYDIFFDTWKNMVSNMFLRMAKYIINYYNYKKLTVARQPCVARDLCID